jgi:secreted PhoX family phosphatase
MSADLDLHDEPTNDSTNPHLSDLIDGAPANRSRRQILQGGSAFIAMAAATATQAATSAGSVPSLKQPSTTARLGFQAVEKTVADRVTLPPGYTYSVLHATGDRITTALPAYSNTGIEVDDWSQRVGDHHDGIELFYLDANGRYSPRDTGRAVLAMNHESSADSHFFHPNGQTSGGVSAKKFHQFGNWDLGDRPGLEVLKEINQHGVSVVELQRNGGSFTYRVDSAYNRRITAQTPMKLAGPAQHMSDLRAMMVTRWDPSGATSRGTLNNCGTGTTPWGTLLTCEENWARYFAMPRGAQAVDARNTVSRRRYGVAHQAITADAKRAMGQGWHTPADLPDTDYRFSRWDVSARGAAADGSQDFRNEPNTFGYNVEIDPLAPAAVPVKRLAMGRLAHEAAVCSNPEVGQPLAFYMGCDSNNEYIYKFVSAALWDPADVGRGLAAGDKYLNEGKLYVARFDADGRGEWIELSIDHPRIKAFARDGFTFVNQADLYVHTRLAADVVGGTRMDRPEWGAINPVNGEVYITLTNNSSRTVARTDAANPRAYQDPDGKKRSGNANGHIIRFREDGGVAGTVFAWDVFLFGSEADADRKSVNLSGLTDFNAFSSPDGLWFSKATGILWIQTDDGAMTDECGCMLLAAVPGKVGDGAGIEVQNSLKGETGRQMTRIGAELGETHLRRFLVAPPGAEVTGIAETPDGRAIFVNIQHPGENTSAADRAAGRFESRWPGNAGYGPLGRPRSATIVITRIDGGVIGI